MRILPAGRRALLVEVGDVAQARALDAELRARQRAGALPAVMDIVAAARTVLLDGVEDRDAMAAAVRSCSLTPPVADAGGPVVEIPVVYDGPDLAWVAAQWGLGVAEAVALHSGADLHAAFCGFSPGFAYLVGLPPRCHLPRRPTPRPLVPAGSVAVAGEFAAVYPRASPGGWHLIGRTAVAMWDAARAQPALVAPGARVRFVPVAAPSP